MVAVVFLYPIKESTEAHRAAEKDRIAKDGQVVSDKLYYTKQVRTGCRFQAGPALGLSPAAKPAAKAASSATNHGRFFSRPCARAPLADDRQRVRDYRAAPRHR